MKAYDLLIRVWLGRYPFAIFQHPGFMVLIYPSTAGFADIICFRDLLALLVLLVFQVGENQFLFVLAVRAWNVVIVLIGLQEFPLNR